MMLDDIFIALQARNIKLNGPATRQELRYVAEEVG